MFGPWHCLGLFAPPPPWTLDLRKKLEPFSQFPRVSRNKHLSDGSSNHAMPGKETR